MTTTTTTSFITFVYHGREQSSTYNLNEPSLKAVAVVVVYLHE